MNIYLDIDGVLAANDNNTGLRPPPLGFMPLLPNQKWHNQTPHLRSENNYI